MYEKRFKVTLNWYGEIRIFWAYAKSEAQAKTFVLKRFAKEIGRENNSVLAYFNGTRDNIKIEVG